MLKFWSVINCFFVHWTKKFTLVWPQWWVNFEKWLWKSVKVKTKNSFLDLIFEQKSTSWRPLSSKLHHWGHANKCISLKKTSLLKEIQLWQTKTSKKINLNLSSVSHQSIRLWQSLFVWSPVEVCQFIMNDSVAKVMDDYKEEQIVTRWER